ncbi:response regulator transcription factor [Streptomyces sp. NPDC048521]|uniref:response regulator transcription factor n=1 Tax=Streptomyces sp. NPDC048521 TaxID=3365566 RepID=UPI003717016C
MDLAVYACCLEEPGHDVHSIAQAVGVREEVAERSVVRLLELHLLTRGCGAQGDAALLAVSPDAAAAKMAAPVEERIREQRQWLSRSQAELSRFLPVYLDRDRRFNAFQVVDNVHDVRHLLNKAALRCVSEVMSAQPGGGTRVPEAMSEALERDRAMLARGIRLRTLYHHTARFNGPSQEYVSAASELGAEYRTVHDLFGRLIVFDREIAFIQTQDDQFGAVVVREPSTVAYLCEIFERTWVMAKPFANASVDGLGEVAREVHRTILRLLAAGLKDEALARRLGMSLRTTRRHVASIMQELGATSRFQAGVIAAQRGLLDDPTDLTRTFHAGA